MFIIPILAVAIVLVKTLCGTKVCSFGETYCYMRFGSVMFLLSALMLMALNRPGHGKILEFTWFGQAQMQLQILGFATMILCGAINEILPRMMGTELPFKKFPQAQFFCSAGGVVIFVITLAIAGVLQGRAVYDPAAAKIPLMISTTGLLLLLIGSGMMLVNIFVMTIKWKIALAKTVYAAVTAPLENSEVKP